jgi:hypothetical protein
MALFSIIRDYVRQDLMSVAGVVPSQAPWPARSSRIRRSTLQLPLITMRVSFGGSL